MKAERRAYRQYVEEAVREGVVESPWEHLQGQLVLGGNDFWKQIRRQLRGQSREQPELGAAVERPTLEAVVGAVEQIKGEPWARFRDRYGDWGRELVLYLGRKQCGLRLKALGEAVGGVDYAAVSVGIKRFEQRLAKESGLQRLVQRANRMLNVET